MIGSLLSGLVKGTANELGDIRQRNLQQEEQESGYQRSVLESLMKGVTEGTVDPAHFARAYQDFVTLGQKRPLRKGVAGFAGQHESPILPFLQMLMGGGAPAASPMGGAPTPSPSAPSPQEGIAPSAGGTRPSRPEDLVGLMGGGAAPPAPALPPPQLPGTGRLAAAARDLATQPPAPAPVAPPSPFSGLFIPPEERVRRDTVGRAQGAVDALPIEHNALSTLVGKENANLALMAKYGYRGTSNEYEGKEYVQDLGDIDPQTGKPVEGYVALANMGANKGQMIWISGPNAGQPAINPQRLYAPPILTDDFGNPTALNRTSGSVQWQGPRGVGRSSLPFVPGAVTTQGAGTTFNRRSGRYSQATPEGAFPGTNPGTTVDEDSAEAAAALKQVEQAWGAFSQTVEGIPISLDPAQVRQWKQAYVQQVWPRRWTLEDLERVAPRPGRVDRATGPGVVNPAAGGKGGRGVSAPPTVSFTPPSQDPNLNRQDDRVRAIVRQRIQADAPPGTQIDPADLDRRINKVMADPTLLGAVLAQKQKGAK